MKFSCKNFFFLQCFSFFLFLYANHLSQNNRIITEIFTPTDSEFNSLKATYPNLLFALGLTLQNKQEQNIQPKIIQENNTLHIIFTTLSPLQTQSIHLQNNLITLSKTQDSHALIALQTTKRYTIATHSKKEKLFVLFMPMPESLAQDSQNLFGQKQTASNTSQETTLQNFNADYEIGSWRYFLVIGMMILVLLALYIVRLKQNKGRQISDIIFEQAKILDSKNKIIVVKYNTTHYLLGLNPNGITLLDKIILDKNNTLDKQAHNKTIEDSEENASKQTQQNEGDFAQYNADSNNSSYSEGQKQYNKKISLNTKETQEDLSSKNSSQTNFTELLHKEIMQHENNHTSV